MIDRERYDRVKEDFADEIREDDFDRRRNAQIRANIGRTPYPEEDTL